MRPGDNEVDEFVFIGCDKVRCRIVTGEFKRRPGGFPYASRQDYARARAGPRRPLRKKGEGTAAGAHNVGRAVTSDGSATTHIGEFMADGSSRRILGVEEEKLYYGFGN
ncbi:hypothetical protein DCS_05489 [Drechmeria coniospora]|uniref:Uncharacterized protein n=1 Tax=Drechmeria coniospora TaxID=98403 RepID=A0A151GMZ0_DRECN|nr:hypothetical protein DCS_05489 [Drechmeria coniospora]KYK58473.1 hypothetical protein DCS_05489 [Drechmeria coniospora]